MKILLLKPLLMCIAAVWTILSIMPFAKAETTYGWALLAIQHKDFPCEVLDTYANDNRDMYVSFLYNSFGTKTKCLKRFVKLAKENPHTIQIYMSNEVGRRKMNLASYEFLPRLTVQEYNRKLEKGNKRVVKRIRRLSKEIKRLCSKIGNKHTNCLITTGLESQFTEKAAKKIVSILKENWNDRQIIHNPVSMATYKLRAGAYYHESHRVFATPQGAPERNIVSLDGDTPYFCPEGGIVIGDRISKPAMRSWSSRYQATTAYAASWCPMHQGLRADSGALGKPRQRVLRVTQREFAEYNRIVKNAKPDNSKYHTRGCDTFKDWGNGELIKESDHGGVVSLFTGKQYDKVTIVEPDGDRYRMSFTGYANPYQGQDRQHWRVRGKSFDAFEDKLVVKARLGSKLQCYKVPLAGQRYD